MAHNDDDVAMLMNMGFDERRAARALAVQGSLDAAIDYLLSGEEGNEWGGGRGEDAAAAATGATTIVHSATSQYSDPLGRSACTAIALAAACFALERGGDPRDVFRSVSLGDLVRDGIELYRTFGVRDGGADHSSAEELLASISSGRTSGGDPDSNPTARNIRRSMRLLDSSPRQGMLSNSPDHPTGLEAALRRCREDAPDPRSYVAAVVTKPPETVLVLLPPTAGRSLSYALLDSHPRPRQHAPHFPPGSYALFHAALGGLAGSLREIFPVTVLGDDVPEMMAMMYNSFDVYPFQWRR